MPVGLINKDGTEVTNNVDNTEHKTIGGDHGQVRTVTVTRNCTTGIDTLFEEGTFDGTIVREDDLAFLFRVGDSLVKEVVDLIGRVHLNVHDEDHGNQNGEDDDSVNVTCQEGCLQSTGGSVQDNTPGDQEGGKTVIDTSQGFDGGGTTEQQHGGHDHIGTEAEEEEGLVGGCAPSCIDDFGNGVCRGSNLLEGDSEDSKKQNLDGGTGGVPVCLKLSSFCRLVDDDGATADMERRQEERFIGARGRI